MALPSEGSGRPSFSPDGQWLGFLATEPDAPEGRTRVVVVDVPGRRVVRELDDGMNGSGAVCFGRGGRFLLTIHAGTQQVSVWDTITWQLAKVISGLPAAPFVVAAVSPGGEILAVSGYGGSLHLWDLENLAPRPPLNLGTGDIHSLAFDAEGKILAIGAIDGTIRLWSLQSHQELGALRGHSSLVESVQFSSNGRTLMSASKDTSIRLWHAPSWQEIQAGPSATQ